MENKKISKNEQEKIIDEKNVSPSTEAGKKTRLQKTKNEINVQHNSIKAGKKSKTVEESNENKNLEELGEYEEYLKQTNNFQLQNKNNLTSEINEVQQNLGLHFPPNLG